MEENLDLTIFVSCFNERHLITQTFDTILGIIKDFDYSYEVLVYDDCSNDDSIEVAHKYISEKGVADRFRVIRNQTNLGIGVNYFQSARDGKGRYLLVMHGDDGVRPETLRAVLNLLGKADMIIPYYDPHILPSRNNFDHRPIGRRVLSMLFTKAAQILGGTYIKYFNGPVLQRREAVLAHEIKCYGLGYQAELLSWQLQDRSVSFIEIRVHNYEFRDASTALKPRNVISVFGSLTRIFLRRITRPEPAG